MPGEAIIDKGRITSTLNVVIGTEKAESTNTVRDSLNG
jgi:hypothetical protein